jgi:hypothetical protein
VVNAAGTRLSGREIGLDAHMQLRGRTARAHLVDVHRAAVVAELAGVTHLHHAGEHRVGGRKIRHADRDRPETPDLVLRRDGAALPRVRVARAAIVHEGEALAFRVLEIEQKPPAALADFPLRDARSGEPLRPPA